MKIFWRTWRLRPSLRQAAVPVSTVHCNSNLLAETVDGRAAGGALAAKRRMIRSRDQLDALMAGVARGDEAAFAELYQVTSPKLYGVALRILHSKEAAEDVVQDSFFKVWERARDFDP